MSRFTWLMSAAVVFASWGSATASPIEAFDDGLMNGWSAYGRQEGSNWWGVVGHRSSNMALLSHTSFTELGLEKRYDYIDGMTLSFDAEFIIGGNNAPRATGGSNFYSQVCYWISLRDADDNHIGWHSGCAATTTYPYTHSGGGWVEFQPTGLEHYEFSIADLASTNGVIVEQVDSVVLGFEGYCSWWSGQNMSIYFDNIAVPEPASLAMLGIGGLTLIRRRRAA